MSVLNVQRLILIILMKDLVQKFMACWLPVNVAITDVTDKTNLHGLTAQPTDTTHSGGTRLCHVLDDACRRQSHVVKEDVVLTNHKFRHGISVVATQHTVYHHEWRTLGNQIGDGDSLPIHNLISRPLTRCSHRTATVSSPWSSLLV